MRVNPDDQPDDQGQREAVPEHSAEQFTFSPPPSPVAAAATTMDWASIIFPITPPVEFAEAIRTGSS